MNSMFLLSLMTIGLLYCRNPISFILYISVIILYKIKYHKLSNLSIILMILIYLHSFSNFIPLNNIVLTTHENYVIASVDYHKILIYTNEPYFFGEEVHVIGEFYEIESNSNFNLFDFKKTMNQQNITHYVQKNEAIIYKKDSIQRKIYERILTFEEKTKNILLKIFYQFDTEHSLIFSSGLHYSYFNQFLSHSFSQLFSTVFLLFFGLLFPMKFSLIRILIGNIVKQLFKNLSRKERIGLQYLTCLMLIPSSVFSLSFILPFLLNVNYLFINDKKIQKRAQLILLIFIQFYYFNTCELLTIFFFSLIRKLNAIYLLLGMIQLVFLQHPFLLYFENVFQWINSMNHYFVFYGHVPFWCGILFSIFYYQGMNHKKHSFYVCCVLLVYLPLQAYFNPFYCVDFINVGQGDSILIRSPLNRYNILIDIPRNKESLVVDYLHALGIHKINALVFTHTDSDHNGGKDLFLQMFDVDEIIEECKDIQLKYVQLISVNTMNHDDDNDNSIVYYASIGNLNYCFMGDASKEVERELLEKYIFDCDVIKIGHHGSRTSTDDSFIQHISPSIAILSVSKHNRYHHPHEEVIQTLHKYSIKTYQTSLHGSISIKSFLIFHFITTSSMKFGIMLKE